MVIDMDAMFSCIFTFCDVRMRIAITCIVPQGASGGLLEKEFGFWGGGGGVLSEGSQ